MTTYTLSPGNIAAVCNVSIDGAPEALSYIYTAPGKPAEGCPTTERVRPFASLPLAVRAAINKHFHAVFAQPLERRGAFLRTVQPWAIEVSQAATSQPCAACGSIAGTAPGFDNNPRCINCGNY